MEATSSAAQQATLLGCCLQAWSLLVVHGSSSMAGGSSCCAGRPIAIHRYPTQTLLSCLASLQCTQQQRLLQDSPVCSWTVRCHDLLLAAAAAAAADSNHSHPVYEEHGVVAKRQLEQHRVRPCGSRDSGLVMHDDDEDGEQPEHRQQHDLAADDISEQLQHLAPAQAAAAAAAASAKRFVKQQADPDGEAPARVKVFYAGLRWGLSLQPSAIKSRQLLAKALNDAYVGEIRSVGQGECLTAVFVDANGATAELGPVKWRGSSKANSSRWRALAKTVARIYVRGPEAPLP
eukprot:GHRQ01037225.1.p1 GENE.GHRQ01037225.1~~GHRQ01037225.1.p1  ORF type:complete len:290 (+),score=99.35 GHRQ01037225.1:688-1557(+)